MMMIIILSTATTILIIIIMMMMMMMIIIIIIIIIIITEDPRSKPKIRLLYSKESSKYAKNVYFSSFRVLNTISLSCHAQHC